MYISFKGKKKGSLVKALECVFTYVDKKTKGTSFNLSKK